MTDTRWTNVDAGPRQVNDFNKALRAILFEGKTFVQLTGTHGDPTSEHRSVLAQPIGGSLRVDATAALEGLGETYDWKVTRDNVRQVTEHAARLLAALQENRPVHDERISPEKAAEQARAREERETAERALRDQQHAAKEALRSRAPAGAKAVIVAEYHEDRSDLMSDYHGSAVTRKVAIGWRYSSREDFKALHAAAASFPETAHMADRGKLEHRENYSMGAGNYLSDHGWSRAGTGWVVRSVELSHCPAIEEVHLPEPNALTTAVVAGSNVTVRPSSLGRDGVVEVVFTAKPAPEVLAALKAHGFRWARSNGCWYGRDIPFAESLTSPLTTEP